MIRRILYTLSFFFVCTGMIAAQPRELVFGVVEDGVCQQTLFVPELLQHEIQEILGDAFIVRFPGDKYVVGDWTLATAKKNLDRLLNDPEVDIVLTNDAIVSNEVSHRKDLPKPVIAPFIMDGEVQGLPRKGRGSGIKNLNYLISVPNIKDAVQSLRRLVKFDHLLIIGAKPYADGIPGLKDRMVQALSDSAWTTDLLIIDRDVEAALEEIPEQIDAVVVTPLQHITHEEQLKLIEILNDRKLPTFSLLGRLDVHDGMFATVTPPVDLTKLARRVALNVQRILDGEDAGMLPVNFESSGQQQLVINMETARKIGVYPSFTILNEAVLLNEQSEQPVQTWDLFSVVQEAVKVNLDLLAKREEVRAGEMTIRQAWSALLPQLELQSTWLMMDRDRVVMSMGQQAEQSVSAGFHISQVFLSEAAFANLEIQRLFQQGREHELQQVRMDIIETAALAYLHVLRTRTASRIRKENLRVTQYNLGLARLRQTIGDVGPAEVYRWEANLAQEQTELLTAENMRKQAVFDLNRILHRPIEEKFEAKEISMADSRLSIGDKRLLEYLNNPVSWKRFRDFITDFTLENSPELKQLDMAIAAQKRGLAASRRVFYIPTVAALFDWSDNVMAEGEGADLMEDNPPDGTDWNLALQASVPVFSGGENIARYVEAKRDLRKFEYQRQSLEDKLRQRIRATVYQTGNSFAKIAAARQAQDSAEKTLEIVTESYSRGLVSNVELIDAQNAAFIARQSAENSIYQFLADFIKASRATNLIGELVDTENRIDVLGLFEQYLQNTEEQ